MFSGINFLSIFLIAESLGVSEFAHFALLHTVGLFIGGILVALIVDPLFILISSGKKLKSNRAIYLWFSVVLICLPVNYFIKDIDIESKIAEFLIIMYYAVIFSLYLLFRKLQFLKKNRKVGLYAAITYMIAVIVLLPVCLKQNSSYIFLFNVMAVLMIFPILVFFPYIIKDDELVLKKEDGDAISANDCFHSGKWLAISSILYWIATQAYVPILVSLDQDRTAGIMRLVQNLMMPLVQVVTLLSNKSVPKIARSNHPRNGMKNIKSVFFRSSLVYVILLASSAPWLLSNYYDEPVFDFLKFIVAIGCIQIFDSLKSSMCVYFNAINDTKSIFISRFLSIIVGLIPVLLVENQPFIEIYSFMLLAALCNWIFLEYLFYQNGKAIDEN